MGIKIEVTENGRETAKYLEQLYLLDREEGVKVLEHICTAARLWVDHVNEEKGQTKMTYKDMVNEFKTAMGQVDDQEMQETLIHEERKEFLKEACDLAYVMHGAGKRFGPEKIEELCEWLDMDFDGAFREVHRSNMSKLGLDGKPVLRGDGKVLKGPNYSQADMESYV